MKKNRTLWYAASIALLLSISLSAFFMTAFSSNDVDPPQNIGLPIDWTMNGALMSADGKVDCCVEFTVSGTIQNPNEPLAQLMLDIQFPSSFQFTIVPAQKAYTSISGQYDSIDYYVFHGYGYSADTNEPVFFTVAMDTEVGLLLILWDDSDRHYIAASKNSNVAADGILSHFQEAIALYGFK